MKRDCTFKALLLQTTGWVVSFVIAHFCKVSFIAGSYMAGFSGINVLMPLSGALGSIYGGVIVFCSQLLFYGTTHTFNFHFLAYFVPGLCAALYWYSSSFFVRLLLPVFCLTLFVTHPIGFYAAPYALFWLIPVGIYFSNTSSLFLHALSSTFIAHAVGSVIWLYSVPMSSTVWLSLIPVVIIERLFFASAIAVSYQVISYLKQMRTAAVKSFLVSANK